MALGALLCTSARAADKPPVDPAAEKQYKDYFGLPSGAYATPVTVTAVLQNWFPPGTPRAKIKARLSNAAPLSATWDNSRPASPRWDISYGFTDTWDGTKWVRNFFCVEITFKFDKSDNLQSLTGRWILVPI
jgi:hypothetical protein